MCPSAFFKSLTIFAQLSKFPAKMPGTLKSRRKPAVSRAGRVGMADFEDLDLSFAPTPSLHIDLVPDPSIQGQVIDDENSGGGPSPSKRAATSGAAEALGCEGNSANGSSSGRADGAMDSDSEADDSASSVSLASDGAANGAEDSSGRTRPRKRRMSSKPAKPRKKARRKADPNKRRNIRKMRELKAPAREAQRAEDERRMRIQGTEIKDAGRYVGDWDGCLNPSRKEGEEASFVVPEIARVVKPHQIEGIRFMWDNAVESLERARVSDGLGCILTHVMGLGKTLQSVAFIEAFLRHGVGKCALIVAPVNTARNWARELGSKWLDQSHRVPVYSLNGGSIRTNSDRATHLRRWASEGGALIVGFEMFRNLSTGRGVKGATLKARLERWLTGSPDLVIVDEGHRIKNDKSGIGQAIKRIKTKRRVVLTGTPLQNNLIEYYCMVDFVRPDFLGSINDFTNLFVNPIRNGQCSDSKPSDKKLMRERAFVLHNKLRGFVHRRDYRHVRGELPEKYDYSLMVRLSPLQKRLYKRYLSQGHTLLFKTYHALAKLCNHPDVLLLHDDEREGAAGAGDKGRSADVWWGDMLDEDVYTREKLEHSGKMSVCLALIKRITEAGDKLVVFSQSLKTLDLLETFMGSKFGFELGRHYFRIDGSISSEARQSDVDVFNDPKSNVPSSVFLVSTRAGSLGINLVGGNHVVIMDASWNPALDLQATFRCYRYGQTKPVYIYRLVAAGTIEEIVYNRQINKRGMALRVVDEQEIAGVLQNEEAKQLYQFVDSDDDNDDNTRMLDLTVDAPLRTRIVVDDESPEGGGSALAVEEFHPVPVPGKIPGKNRRKRRRRPTVSSLSNVVELQRGTPVAWLAATYGQGEQARLAKAALVEDAEQPEAADAVPAATAPPATPHDGPPGRPAGPSILVASPAARNTTNKSGGKDSRKNTVKTGKRKAKGEKEVIRRLRAFRVEPRAWIKSIHKSKELLQHHEESALTKQQQTAAIEAYKREILREQKNQLRAQQIQQRAGTNTVVAQVATWKVRDVLSFLDHYQLGVLKTPFQQHGIDGGRMLHITNEDLIHLGVTLNVRQKLLLTVTREILWRGSPALVKDWTVHAGPNGDPYFYNKRTGQSQWDRPDALIAELEDNGVSLDDVMSERYKSRQTPVTPVDLSGDSAFNGGAQVQRDTRGGRPDDAIDLTDY